MRPPVRFAAAAVLLLALALTGCASSEPPSPPLSADTYASPWLIVPVHPSTDDAETPDSTLATYYDRMLQEVTTTMDRQDQRYSVYAGSPHSETGISADSLYEAVPESEQEQVNADQRINVDVLRAVADETDATHILVVDPNTEVHAEKPSLLGVSARVLADGALSLGDLLPLSQLFGTKKARVTASMVWEVTQTTGETPDSAHLQPVWGRLRAATPEAHGLAEDVDAVGYGFRSMIVEMRTGRPVYPSWFTLESDEPVTVYRHTQPRLRGTALHVDGIDFVVKQRDGSVIRVPVHTVTKIKNPAQNRDLL